LPLYLASPLLAARDVIRLVSDNRSIKERFVAIPGMVLGKCGWYCGVAHTLALLRGGASPDAAAGTRSGRDHFSPYDTASRGTASRDKAPS
jgi:hypothetical protein